MGIKQPPAYEHPNKRNRRSGSGKPQTIAPVERAKNPVKEKRGNEKPSDQSVDSGKVVLRMAAHPPALGEFDLFDQMVTSGITPREAVLALLRRGTKKLDDIANMPATSLKKLTYARDGEAIETNRSISAQCLQTLKTNIDPFGVLTTRAFGIKIGEAVLMLSVRQIANGKT